MNIADKPYAELMKAAEVAGRAGYTLLPGMLKAAKALPPERSAMMMAAFDVYLSVQRVWVELGQPNDCPELDLILKARDAMVAFIEEARWKSL
jgi:hypothetical protein